MKIGQLSQAMEELKIPPQDIEAERAAIASYLLATDDHVLRSEMRQLLKPSHFFADDNRIIWEVACQIIDGGGPIDGLILRDALQRKRLLEEVGGTSYIGDIFSCVPSYTHGKKYAEIVRNAAMGRGIITVAERAMKRAYERGGISHTQTAAAAEAEFAKLAIEGTDTQIVSLADAAIEVYENLGKGGNRFVCTGFPEVDQMIGGLPIGGFTLIGAPPGMGKSAIAKQIMLNSSGFSVSFGIVSLEETRSKIAANAMSNVSGVDNHKIVFDRISREDSEQLARALNTIAEKNIFISDTCRTITDIEAAGTLLAKQHGCKVLFVDHLHLIDGESSQNRTQEVSKISRCLKLLGKKLDVAMVGLCQLNRGESEESAKLAPTLRRFKDSGSLEADGDVIVGLHRPDYFAKDPSELTGELQFHVLKNKSGACGKIPLYWNGNQQRIGTWNKPIETI